MQWYNHNKLPLSCAIRLAFLGWVYLGPVRCIEQDMGNHCAGRNRWNPTYFTRSLGLVSWSHRWKQKRGKHHFISQNGFITKRQFQGQSRYFFFWLISRSLLFTGGLFHGHLPLHCVVYLIGAWCHSAWCTWWDHLLPKTRRRKALRATGEKENTGLW